MLQVSFSTLPRFPSGLRKFHEIPSLQVAPHPTECDACALWNNFCFFLGFFLCRPSVDTLVFFTFTDITRAWRVAHNDKKSLDLENVQLLIIVLVVVFFLVVVVTCSCCFWSVKAFSSFEQKSLEKITCCFDIDSFSVQISCCVYKGFTKFGVRLQQLSLPGEFAGSFSDKQSTKTQVAKPMVRICWESCNGSGSRIS